MQRETRPERFSSREFFTHNVQVLHYNGEFLLPNECAGMQPLLDCETRRHVPGISIQQTLFHDEDPKIVYKNLIIAQALCLIEVEDWASCRLIGEFPVREIADRPTSIAYQPN